MSETGDLYGVIYEKGDVIFRQGDRSQTLYLIQSGAVEICSETKGKEIAIDIVQEGDFFGEMALIDRRPRSATVRAIRRSRVLPFTRDQFVSHARNDPDIILHLIRVLGQRINRTGRLLKNLVDRDEDLRHALSKGSPWPDLGKAPESGQAWRPEECTSSSDNGAHNNSAFGENIALEDHELQWHDKGQVIYRQGEPGLSMYIIVKGEVEIIWQGEGEQWSSVRMREKDFIGEAAFLTGLPHATTARAIAKTGLLPINAHEFPARMRDRPELAPYILKELILRLRLIHESLENPAACLGPVTRLFPPPMKHKEKITLAMIPLSSCGGCTTAFLADKKSLEELMASFKVVYSPMLMDQGEIPAVDMAIVDGVVRVEEDIHCLQEARKKARLLIAWGTCSALGGVPTLANQFELEELIDASHGQAVDHLAFYLSGTRGTFPNGDRQDHEGLLRRAYRADNFVRIDYYIPGCPPNPALLAQMAAELAGRKADQKTPPVVCGQCGRKFKKILVKNLDVFPPLTADPELCLLSNGTICLGSLTKGGCGGVCPRGGLPCWGCRGPSSAVIKKLIEGESFQDIFTHALKQRTGLSDEALKPVVREVRHQTAVPLGFAHNLAADLVRLR